MEAEQILEALPDAVIVLDADKNILGWHGAASRLFGWDRDEVLGKSVEDHLRPRDENGNKCYIGPKDPARLLQITKAMPEYDVMVSGKADSEVWVGISCSFLRDAEGGLEKIVVIARDASGRKRIDLEKSEVISAVSHELRSPLTSVKGFTSTLINKWDRFDDETKLQLLRTINADADRVTRMLGELLDVSRIEAGRLQLRRQPTDIWEIVDRVVHKLQPESDSHVLKANAADGIPSIYADPDKIEQVLTNLLENAVKYTSGGTVTVEGEVVNESLHVRVTDEGEGIPDDHRLNVFGKFFRHGEKRGGASGTGLGLYISKGLVEAHGGTMWVEDAPGGGAMFAFTLPVQEPEFLTD